MANILFLVHRIPYPPNKGDKIRSWNMLKYLLGSHQVHLGCFVDDPADFEHVAFLAERCASVKAIDLTGRAGKAGNLVRGLIQGEPLTVAWYHSAEMQDWVDGLMGSGNIDCIVLFSSATARFIVRHAEKVPVIMDFVDMDSDKWQQYANSKSFPLSLVYQREAGKLLQYEKQICALSTAALFVTDDEVALFRSSVSPDMAEKIHAMHNGVDAVYFSPDHAFEPVAEMGTSGVCFTGAMDYWANEDAVVWFAENVWPKVLIAVPDAFFYIVGGKPGKMVQELDGKQRIRVTGRVEDVRPYIAASALVVAPMRIARGVQNKVLEGMAMAKTVITSSMGFEGITARPAKDLIIADSADDYAAAVIEVLQEKRDTATMGERARQLVLDAYSWDANLAVLDRIIGGLND